MGQQLGDLQHAATCFWMTAWLLEPRGVAVPNQNKQGIFLKYQFHFEFISFIY